MKKAYRLICLNFVSLIKNEQKCPLFSFFSIFLSFLTKKRFLAFLKRQECQLKKLFRKQLQPDEVTKLLLFVFESPSKRRSKMFVLVARFVSLLELKTESKNTHKKSCDIVFPPFQQKFYI